MRLWWARNRLRMTKKNGEAPVEVVPYDPAWPALFLRERLALEAAIGPWLAGPIEHIGSTAVPGLLAKPVIDIMAAVEDLEVSRPAIAALAPLEYCYYPYRADVMHWFCKPSPALRTHHLHLVPFNSKLWGERLTFRDALRQSPQLAAEYARLKQRLAEQFKTDREGYTDAKWPFIQRVIEQHEAA